MTLISELLDARTAFTASTGLEPNHFLLPLAWQGALQALVRGFKEGRKDGLEKLSSDLAQFSAFVSVFDDGSIGLFSCSLSFGTIDRPLASRIYTFRD
jgi:hypothetical protein